MQFNRRNVLKAVGLLGTAGIATTAAAQVKESEVPQDSKIKNGRIRQSVMGWCLSLIHI